jgi:hypothetical protein
MALLRRRSVLAALGMALPSGLFPAARNLARASGPTPAAPALRLLPLEESVRLAFAGADLSAPATRRVECGHSDLLRAGLQGCANASPFAGFAPGSLRITRTGSAPGPSCQGIRLYVCTLDLTYTPGGAPGRPLDFALIPPAPTLGRPAPEPGSSGSETAAHTDKIRGRANRS